MSGMSTETLAGRDLDVAVAEAMGHGWQGGNPIPGLDGRWPWPPPYSSADCSGLAPVLAWLRSHLPNWWDDRLEFEMIDGGWVACADYENTGCASDPSPPRYDLVAEGTTLPEAACRLVLMLAARRDDWAKDPILRNAL